MIASSLSMVNSLLPECSGPQGIVDFAFSFKEIEFR